MTDNDLQSTEDLPVIIPIIGESLIWSAINIML